MPCDMVASDAALAYAQLSQVIVGVLCTGDASKQVRALVRCLRAFPRGEEKDMICGLCALRAVVDGLFGPRHTIPLHPIGSDVFAQLVGTVWRQFPKAHLRLDDLSEELRVSRFCASRAVRAGARCRYSELVSCIRILKAIHLLSLGGLQIKAVAMEVGFETTAELDRHMHKRLGLSPTAVQRLGRYIPGSAITT